MQLEKATELVTKLWFPFNRSILSSVKSRLESEDFYAIRDEIVGELEKDLSLFLLCLKELVSMLGARGMALPGDEMGAHEFFSHVTREEFEIAISQVSKFRCHQRLDAASKFQKHKLVEMYISGVAVKTISEKLIGNGSAAVSRELNYSSVLLRQLGATLIAWNYPQIYEKVATARHSPDSFDEALRSALGFSPMMLGFSVAQSWNLPPIYLRIIGGDEGFKESGVRENFSEREKKLADSVVHICEIGEALSRAMNPELFSTSVLDLDKASKYIQKVIGEQGVKEILNETKKQLRFNQFSSLDSLIDESTNLLVKKVSSTKFSSSLVARNTYLDAVPDDLREAVLDLYGEMTSEGSVQMYTAAFAKKIIPASAFSNVIIYLNDPFKQVLFPSLIIGNPKALTPSLVTMSGAPSSYNMISAGFGLKTPLREDRVIGENEEIVMLATALGADPAIGVFYAEANPLSSNFPINIMRYFKAIKFLLCDCLRLEIKDEQEKNV